MDNDGKTISGSNDRIRNNRVCRELTIKYGLYMPKGKENVKYDRLRGKDKHKYENEVISHTGNSIINTVADLLLQHLNIQQPQQSENNQELNSLLKETIVNAVNDTINAHINSKENYADEVCRRCKNTIDFAIERETKLVNNVLLPQLSPYYSN